MGEANDARPLDHEAIAQLLDERAIERLLISYCRAVDDGRSAEIPKLFERDGTLHLMGRATVGHDALLALYGAAGGPVDRPSTTHALTNIQIHLDGDVATCVSDFAVVARGADGTIEITMAGRYLDEVRRSDDDPHTWRFVVRRVQGHAKVKPSG